MAVDEDGARISTAEMSTADLWEAIGGAAGSVSEIRAGWVGPGTGTRGRSPPGRRRNIEHRVRAIIDAPHAEALGDRSGDKHAVGDVADIALGDMLETVAAATFVERLELGELA